ncbi:DUF1488 family protein [Sphingomonas morindae]|uniref:DUF1488 domain-containing protein n=1 Tax=Sphingomonas morindae TaxID=1541170 RepID=A0ABY4X441_9SPHN|nr:DUF1488 family protein [Sphingomonas morindae]USI71644.1 DUF1488 domain-containing protein [Sphingomonas morindae]
MGILTFSLETLGHDAKDIPPWKFREKPVRCEVTLDALAELYGPIPGAMTPEQVFAEVRQDVERAAHRKIDQQGEGFTEPVRIDVDDI